MLREARRRLGWSQATLADRAGVQQSVVAAYESGSREPAVSALRRLARAMGMEVALVAGRRLDRPDPPQAARQLEDALGLVDAMHLRPAREPLRYPILARRT